MSIDSANIYTCTDKHADPYANNGLITSIWGPPTWESFHSITFGYPQIPTMEEKIDYLNYFKLLGKVLPCIYCRTSYQKFITESQTLLDFTVVESRKTLTYWGWKLHNAVNKKLDVDYGVSFEEVCYRYEAFRAKCKTEEKSKGCVMPLNIKADSYTIASRCRTPIVNVSICMPFYNYAKKKFKFYNFKKMVLYYSTLAHDTIEWNKRDFYTKKIMMYMKKHAISPLDKYGMPCYYETILLTFLCSNLEITKLTEISKNLL